MPAHGDEVVLSAFYAEDEYIVHLRQALVEVMHSMQIEYPHLELYAARLARLKRNSGRSLATRRSWRIPDFQVNPLGCHALRLWRRDWPRNELEGCGHAAGVGDSEVSVFRLRPPHVAKPDTRKRCGIRVRLLAYGVAMLVHHDSDGGPRFVLHFVKIAGDFGVNLA